MGNRKQILGLHQDFDKNYAMNMRIHNIPSSEASTVLDQMGIIAFDTDIHRFKYFDGTEIRILDGAVTIPPTVFRGVADVDTNPGTPTGDEWWSASEVGIYTNFGGLEVTTLDGVYNWLVWSHDNQTWSIEQVPTTAVFVPTVQSNILDFYVNPDQSIGARAYAAKSPTPLDFAYVYNGTDLPSSVNRVNIDGKLYVSELGIGLGTDNALLYVIPSTKKIGYKAIGTTAGTIAAGDHIHMGTLDVLEDDILDWNVNKYQPYTAKKLVDTGPYFYTSSDPYPTFTTKLAADAWFYATEFHVQSGVFNTRTTSQMYALGSDTTSLYMKLKLEGGHIYSRDSGDYSDPIMIGEPLTTSTTNGEYILVDDWAQRFDINFTKVRFNKGTASKWLALNSTKEIVYVDPPAYTFLTLADVIATTYSTKAYYVPMVTQTEDSLDLVPTELLETITAKFTYSSDVPNSYVGMGGKIVQVRGDELGLEFVDLGASYDVNIPLGFAPASASSAGTAGDLVSDDDYLYYCVASGNWKRAAIQTW